MLNQEMDAERKANPLPSGASSGDSGLGGVDSTPRETGSLSATPLNRVLTYETPLPSGSDGHRRNVLHSTPTSVKRNEFVTFTFAETVDEMETIGEDRSPSSQMCDDLKLSIIALDLDSRMESITAAKRIDFNHKEKIKLRRQMYELKKSELEEREDSFRKELAK